MKVFLDQPNRQAFDRVFCKYYRYSSPEEMYINALEHCQVCDMADVPWLAIGGIDFEIC